MRLGRAGRFVDERLGVAHFARRSLDKVFPDHWSFLLGEIALYSLMVLIVTGTYLTLFFRPESGPVTYTGSYGPLQGQEVSAAYDSVVRLSFDVRAGLLVRQVHHWAALVFLAAIVAHLCRIFFTGAFRRPREINWIVGATMLILAMANGVTGYSLPDDLLSGTGLRVMNAIVLSIPVVGTWTAFLAFGGEYPAAATLSRLYIVHVLLVPGLLIALVSIHLAIIWRQKHTQFPGRGHTETNVVGTRLWPTYAAKSIGLLVSVTAVLVLLGGLVQINPVWLYGPYQPAAVSTASQPDWYVGFLEGALRIAPGWSLTIFGHTIPEVFVPGVVLPGLTFAALYAWPFLERWRTGDRREHHVLDRPRDRPVRTAVGTGVLAFYAVLTVAGAQDLVAQALDAPVSRVVWILRVALVVVPVAVALLTAKVCRDLARTVPLVDIAEPEDTGDPDDDRAGEPVSSPAATGA